MALNELTVKSIARLAAEVLEDEMPFLSNINRGREDEFSKTVNGYKIGDYIDIRIPPTAKVYTGATFAEGGTVADVDPGSVRLQFDTHKHTGLTLTASDMMFKESDIKEKVIRPQLASLASTMEAIAIEKAVLATPNLVGSAGTVPTTAKTYGQARAQLQAFLASPADRNVLFSSDANLELVDASKALFNAPKEISRQYTKGAVGEFAGAMFYESQDLPNVTIGNKVTGVQVNGASQTGSSLNIKGLTAADTIKKGTVFTMVVKAVQPLTGASYAFARQFVVTSDFTATGATGTISIYPPIDAAMPGQTVSASPADSAALTFVGSASTAYRQNLMYQKDAFTAAFAPVPIITGCEGYTARTPGGLAVTVQRGGSFTNLTDSIRVDIMMAFAAVRPDHACRITE